MGSRGSVIPFFMKKVKEGEQTLPITSEYFSEKLLVSELVAEPES